MSFQLRAGSSELGAESLEPRAESSEPRPRSLELKSSPLPVRISNSIVNGPCPQYGLLSFLCFSSGFPMQLLMVLVPSIHYFHHAASRQDFRCNCERFPSQANATFISSLPVGFRGRSKTAPSIKFFHLLASCQDTQCNCKRLLFLVTSFFIFSLPVRISTAIVNGSCS